MSALDSFQKVVNDHIHFSSEEIPMDILVVEELLRAIEVAQKQLKQIYLHAPAAFSDGAQETIDQMDRHILNAYKKHSIGCRGCEEVSP